MLDQLNQIFKNLGGLGAARAGVLAGVGLLIVSAIFVGAIYVNKPTYAPIYVGLELDDVARMGQALSEAGIAYDVNAEGNSVLVAVGQTSRARMVLAEKGLPSSSNTGYELFDNLGSLGLTAFMQEVTRVRALEGEIARSIQTIQGVKAARVHIVMAEQGNFRRAEQPPTASVVVRYQGSRAQSSAMAIRHLVASAVPALSTENVTVLDASGRLLAAGEDPLGKSAGSNLGIKSNVENQVAASVQRALSPYLGDTNFRVSVQADISTDQRQVEETIYDPDSRVERSVQVVRSENASSLSSGADPVTVEQNIVDDVTTAGAGPSESERNERREETTNYELNTKKVATISTGYRVTRLSVAVIVNRASLATVSGANGEAVTLEAEAVEARLEEIRTLISAASGISEERADVVEVTAVDFLPVEADETPAAQGIVAMLAQYASGAVNAVAFLIGVGMLIMLGIRPLLAMLATPSQASGGIDQQESFADIEKAMEPELELPDLSEPAEEDVFNAQISTYDQSELLAKMRPAPADRLTMIVDLDEARAAAILRRWVNQEPA